MKACIAHIRYAVTGSELVALLKESDEIKRFKPIFNRAQRKSRFNVGLFASHDAQGYLQFRTERIRKHNGDPVAAFSSLLEANGFLERMLDEHQLCQKHTGLQKVKGPCFYFGIHKCLGACVGTEPAGAYNLRAQNVVTRLQYVGRNLLIVDEGRKAGEKSLVMVEQGKYRGYGYVEEEFLDNEVPVLKACISAYSDNKDVRQIINLYLRQGKGHRIIEFS